MGHQHQCSLLHISALSNTPSSVFLSQTSNLFCSFPFSSSFSTQPLHMPQRHSRLLPYSPTAFLSPPSLLSSSAPTSASTTFCSSPHLLPPLSCCLLSVCVAHPTFFSAFFLLVFFYYLPPSSVLLVAHYPSFAFGYRSNREVSGRL